MARQSQPTCAAELWGQPPAPTTGRERLIAAGIGLFYSGGFQAVGLDRVIEHAGVTKTTFYKHFDSKDDLVLACVRAREEWESQAWARAVKKLAGDDPRGQLLAFFKVLDVWFNDPGFHGCMFNNVAMEFADKRDPIHQAAADQKRRMRERFRSLAAQAGAGHPDDFADHFMILLDGTVVLRHVHGRDDAARVAIHAVMELVERHMPLASVTEVITTGGRARGPASRSSAMPPRMPSRLRSAD